MKALKLEYWFVFSLCSIVLRSCRSQDRGANLIDEITPTHRSLDDVVIINDFFSVDRV